MGARCGSRVTLDQAGYISWTYGNNVDCYINLVAPGASDLLYLQILENRIEGGGSSCYDHLYVYEGIHTGFSSSGIHADICGSSGITEYTSSLDHTLTLRLVSDVSTPGSFTILYTAYADPFGPGAACESGFSCDVTDRCIHPDLRCDTMDNCGDGSDELSCLTSGDTWVCSDGSSIPASLLCDGTRDCSDHGDERTTFPTYCASVEIAPSCYSSVYLQPDSSGYIVYSNNASYSGTVCATHLYTAADYTVQLGPFDLTDMPGGCADSIHVCDGNAMYTCEFTTSTRSFCLNEYQEDRVRRLSSEVTIRLEGGTAAGGNFKIFYRLQYIGPQSLSTAAIVGIAAGSGVVVMVMVGVAVYCCYSNNNRSPSTPRVGVEGTPREHIPMQAYPQLYPASSSLPYTSELSAHTSSSLPYADLPYTLHPPPAYSADPSSAPPPYMAPKEPHRRLVQHQPDTGHQGLPYPD
ncbi:PREDICTED: uncharacterized protein LOC109462101 [Branchiostoma belcheri]|uniref:Uncharacterized protein LOC109462101 n=1 Tax=Branchiostoma belcheri TaxID=7741 RepID=A0A6P4Y624_BRABE|nr:PREDICTED: uncharacterized protein LOC109462101 [Branchiostoma belcheri]